jgi:competence protein ComEC
MRTGMVLLCLGLAACSWLPALPPGPLWLARLLCAVCVLALAVVFLWLPAGPARAWLSGHSALCLLLCFCSGLSWSVQFGKQLEARRLPVALEGQDIWVEGVVEGLIRPRERNNQVQLKISAVCLRLQPAACSSQPAPQPAQQMVGGRIVLNDYNQLPIQSGERWWLRVRLHRVHGLANPGAYDFEAAQAQQGIIARGYIRDTTLNHRLAPARWQLDALRAAALTRLQAVPWPPACGHHQCAGGGRPDRHQRSAVGSA